MDTCSNPTGRGVNHVAVNLTLFLCAYYNADMLPTYPYATYQLDIVSTSADTVFGCVADMLANMLTTCRANTHVSVDSTIFLTFKNPTFPVKALLLLPRLDDNACYTFQSNDNRDNLLILALGKLKHSQGTITEKAFIRTFSKYD